MNWIFAGMFLCLLDPHFVPLAIVFYFIGLLED